MHARKKDGVTKTRAQEARNKSEDLTPEQLAKADACETPEDYLALAREVGYELTNEELDQVASGYGEWFQGQFVPCPNCGTKIATRPGYVKCPDCRYEFTFN